MMAATEIFSVAVVEGRDSRKKKIKKRLFFAV